MMTTVPGGVWPALTATDFQMHDHVGERILPFIEDENGNGVYGYGHWDKAQFAAAVNDYFQLRWPDLDAEDWLTAGDVTHVWAVVTNPQTQRFSWDNVTADNPNAFPVTVIQL
ncbi:hypothetical protein [Mycolicibacterium fortuitum]|nr:hypothetical protein [Mycolicibacterium fortuitum]